MTCPVKTIVCLGDSITNNDLEPSYVNYWQDLCDLTYGAGAINIVGSGVCGETAYQAYSRLSQVFSQHPQLLTILYGHNDLNQCVSPKVFQYHLQQLITAARDNMVEQIWLLTPNKINSDLIAPAYLPYRASIRSLTLSTRTTFIDLWDLFEDQDLNSIFTYDYLHPNQLGHQLIAKRLMKQLEQKPKKRTLVISDQVQ